MRRVRAVAAAAALTGVAVLAPTAGTLAVFTDTAPVTSAVRTFDVTPPALTCTPRSPAESAVSATLSWPAQRHPGTGGGYLTQAATSTYGGNPLVTGTGEPRSTTFTVATYSLGLTGQQTRTFTVTVTSSLGGWSESSTQQLHVSRATTGSGYVITCL